MSPGRKVIIYGANGYTGKLVAESLAQRQIPFYFAGRSRDKLEKALGIVRERLGADAYKLDAEIVAVDNSVDTLLRVPQVQRRDQCRGTLHAGRLAGRRGRAEGRVPLHGHHRRTGLGPRHRR